MPSDFGSFSTVYGTQSFERQPGVSLALLGRSSAVVLELRPFALERAEVLRRLRFGGVQLGLELIDVGQKLGWGDVDLVHPLLDAGPMWRCLVTCRRHGCLSDLVRRRGVRQAHSSGPTRSRPSRSRLNRPCASV